MNSSTISSCCQGCICKQGNPRREARTGDGLNFVVDYTYSYEPENRPISKRGALTITNGADAGRQIQTSSVFTYY
jgi:hypothetical protein